MLKSAVPIYYFISEKLLPYFLKLPSVCATGKKLKFWNKEHIHSRKYLLAVFSLKYFWESNNNTTLQNSIHIHKTGRVQAPTIT
jgi:hypothetical protein